MFYWYSAEETQQEEKAEPKKKKGPPPKWDEFLKERYQDGKKKVPNSNPKTRDRYPTVSMTTLMGSDSGFRKKVFKEYSEWIKKQDKDKPSKGKTKKKDESSSPKRAKLVFDVEDQIKKFGDEYKEHFKKKWDSALTKVGEIEGNRFRGGMWASSDREAFQESEVAKMSPEEKAVCFFGHMAHITVPGANRFYNAIDRWTVSSKNYAAMQLHGLVQSLGVSGSFADPLGETDKAGLESGVTDADLREHVAENYAMTQAFFRHAGITHVTLYRGVDGQGLDREPPKSGDRMKCETRPLSSWSFEPKVGANFGKRVVKIRVPVESIFACSVTCRDLDRDNNAFLENEVIVMGSSDYEAEVAAFQREDWDYPKGKKKP